MFFVLYHVFQNSNTKITSPQLFAYKKREQKEKTVNVQWVFNKLAMVTGSAHKFGQLYKFSPQYQCVACYQPVFLDAY